MKLLDSLAAVNWSSTLIGTVSVLYLLTAIAFIAKKDYPSFVIFIGYVIANIGFLMR